MRCYCDLSIISVKLEQMVVEVGCRLAMVIECKREYRVGSGAFIFFNLTRQDYS